jgi:hypothetical protein
MPDELDSFPDEDPEVPPTGPLPGPLQAPLHWDPTGAIGFGWATMRREPTCILVLFLALLVGNLVSTAGAVFNGLQGMKGDPEAERLGLMVYAGCFLLNLPISLWMQVGITRYALKLARRQPAGIEDVFRGGPILAFLGATILISLGVLGGMLLLIIPGIMFALGWMFTAQFIVDRGLPPWEAIGASWRLTSGHKWALALFALLAFGVALLGYLACCVGIFVAVPVLMIAMAYVYLRLCGEVTPNPQG